MVMMILEHVPASLRGELTRWLIEPHPGVFVGHVTAMVRDRLWDKCARVKAAGGVVQAWSTNTEQRFRVRVAGRTKRAVVDFDGLQLIRVPPEAKRAAGRDGAPSAPAEPQGAGLKETND